MGFSISAAAAVIGVSLLMIVEISLGTIIPLYVDIQESYDQMKDRAVDELQTSVTIANVNTTVNASGYDLNVTIRNSGSTVIDTRYVHVLIDGASVSFSCSSTYIHPENTNYILVHGLTGSGEKKVKVITQNGISCYDSYIV